MSLCCAVCMDPTTMQCNTTITTLTQCLPVSPSFRRSVSQSDTTQRVKLVFYDQIIAKEHCLSMQAPATTNKENRKISKILVFLLICCPVLFLNLGLVFRRQSGNPWIVNITAEGRKQIIIKLFVPKIEL